MITTIFWPIDPHGLPDAGFAYGWTRPALCVAGVIEATSNEEAEAALQSLYSQAPLLATACGAPPTILGPVSAPPSRPRRGRPHPVLGSWAPEKYSLIFYHRHRARALRFYALDALELDATPRPPRSASPYAAAAHRDFTAPPRPAGGLDGTVIAQFNAAAVLAAARGGRAPPRWSLLPPSFSRYLTIALTGLAAALARPALFAARALTAVCNARVPLCPGSLRLKDVSATMQQVDVRAEQVRVLIGQALEFREHDGLSIASFAVQYVSFYNAVWLILNDVTIGLAFGSFLCENDAVLARILDRWIESYLIGWIQWALVWLDSWPAGLKLNTELSHFYSHTLIDLVATWGHVLRRHVAPRLPLIVYAIGTLSGGGLTLAAAAAADLLALLTAHALVAYVLVAAVYARVLQTAHSLWHLFRGKRYNVLRARLDTHAHDVDQLLLGTMLFTLLAFLFPTVAAYYALFAAMRLAALAVHAGTEALGALMNHFPLFALTLRAKDPWRLPGGVSFIPDTATFENRPIPLGAIFFQYARLWPRLAAHYSPLRLLRCLFVGAHLAGAPQDAVRYSGM